jgi:hypothetical protein
MQYYFSKTIKSDFNKAIETVTQALKEKGFGIITEIDLQETFRKNWMSTSGHTGSLVPAIHILLTRHYSRKTKSVRCCLAMSLFRIRAPVK